MHGHTQHGEYKLAHFIINYYCKIRDHSVLIRIIGGQHIAVIKQFI